jgi:hypothetical protein
MRKVRTKRPAGSRRRTMIAVMALMAPLAALGIASPAQAELKGALKVFAQCPTGTPGVTLCTYGLTTGGSFTIGTTKVPINKTITLQGGEIEDPFEEGSYFLAPAKNGESISKTELNVPGGLLGLINCEEIKGSGFWESLERGACKAIFENKTTGVTATTESVANEHNPPILNPTNIFTESGIALTLPVRVHLKNPLLGNSCYIGSESSPIELRLTTGTTSPPEPNKPIKGKKGTISVEEELVVAISENSLVDNSYSAPVAEGCGEFFSFLIDPILDAKLKLPSAAGHNTAILEGTLRTTSAEAVINGEK